MAKDDTYPCMECETGRVKDTDVCSSCGAVYRRGVLVQGSRGGMARRKAPRGPQDRVRTRQRDPPCPGCGKPRCTRQGDPGHIGWTSWQSAATREEAIERMFDYYDAHPGRRRRLAREAFEVTQVRHAWPLEKGQDAALWIVHVRNR